MDMGMGMVTRRGLSAGLRWAGMVGLGLGLGLVVGCGDKADKETGGADDTGGGGGGDDTGEVTSPSDFVSGQYRVSAFALSSLSTEGVDIDGDGEVDNKLPSVLSLAATLTGEPLKVDDLNAVIAADLAKGALVLLTEAEQVGVSLRVDMLLGTATAKGDLAVDAASYASDGTPNSRMLGAFETETAYGAAAERIELPFPLLPGGAPVLVPLELVQATGTLDASGNGALVGGAVPVDDFMVQVIEPLIPTGEDYDPELYLDMTREELIDFIYTFASGETVADILLPDGRKAVSAAVTYTAEPASF